MSSVTLVLLVSGMIDRSVDAYCDDATVVRVCVASIFLLAGSMEAGDPHHRADRTLRRYHLEKAFPDFPKLRVHDRGGAINFETAHWRGSAHPGKRRVLA